MLMNLMADVLFVLGGAMLAAAAVLAVQRLPFFPLRHVEVVGGLDQVGRGQIEHAARTALTGNFFTVNLDSARVAFEKLPWVRRAEVRRHWPDTLTLALEEHRAVARWKPAEGGGGQEKESLRESRLVNTEGEIFAASTTEALPTFVGPEGSEDLVLARYREFAEALAPLSHEPRTVVLSPRQAWQLRLDNGLVLDLGRDQPKHPLAERIARFATHYREAAGKAGFAAGVVDMRYPNGFALRAGRVERKS